MSQIKLFVSGKFADKSFIKAKMNELETLGYCITHDWATHEKSHDNKNDLMNASVLDINGVKESDIHIIIITDTNYPYRGTFTELGCSLGLNKQVFIWCPFEKASCMSNPFYYHPLTKHFVSWDKLLEELKNIKK